MEVACACPQGYQPDAQVLAFAKSDPSHRFTLTENILEAAADADVLITDVWASMGQESEREERKRVFQGYQINASVMAAAKPSAIVQHCLPAHKGEEIDGEVFEAHAAEIFEEAENRLHAQKAVMAILMGSL